MPGYPNEWHELWAVFLIRQRVLIVPAAPSWDASLTAAVLPSQRAIADADALVDVLGVGAVVVAVVAWAVEEAGPVGTVPASWAPLLQPATMKASAKVEMRALVMR